MRERKASSSAQAVALARAHLHWAGFVDDPLAETMLTSWRRLAALALRRWPLTRYGRSATFSFLGARTQFFDDAVNAAIEAGVEQVVIVGAGYDSRGWRLARPSVRYFEVDHPATQRDKRRRAPDGGVTYVPVDLLCDPLDTTLVDAGFDVGEPAVFVIEGLTMYLTEGQTEQVFARLAGVAVGGSRLAANFTAAGGGSVAPVSRVVARVIRTAWWLSGEPMTHWATPGKVAGLLDRTGWDLVESLTGPAVAERYLSGTRMSIGGVSAASLCVTCGRRLGLSRVGSRRPARAGRARRWGRPP